MPLEASSSAGTISVPLPRVAGFIRQVTHDVRNGLNSMDLQAAYLAELITQPEAVEELRRLRGLIHSTARQLQSVSANFWTATPSFVTYSARILIEDLQDPEDVSRGGFAGGMVGRFGEGGRVGGYRDALPCADAAF